MPVLNDASATPKVDDLIVTDEISVRHVAFDAPWDWLGGGWRDMWTVPVVSLAYGALFAFAAAASPGAPAGRIQSVILALAGGFLLIGPLAAVGLYERAVASRPVSRSPCRKSSALCCIRADNSDSSASCCY